MNRYRWNTSLIEPSLWEPVHKGDARCRALADRHYSRQHPGHPMFCRPGYNLVLWHPPGAVFVWFRPKWESGIRGTERKDKLRAIECTLFRNESSTRSSDLIKSACWWLKQWEHALDVEWPDGAITGVSSLATTRGRSLRSPPGACFRHAGWQPIPHRASDRADVWLGVSRETFYESLPVE